MSKRHFNIKNLDISKPVLSMAYDPHEKHIMFEPKEYEKTILK